MSKHAELEVQNMTNGKTLFALATKEFENSFDIIARTQEYIVLGDKDKNVKFCREKLKKLEQYVFDKVKTLSRKGVL